MADKDKTGATYKVQIPIKGGVLELRLDWDEEPSRQDWNKLIRACRELRDQRTPDPSTNEVDPHDYENT